MFQNAKIDLEKILPAQKSGSSHDAFAIKVYDSSEEAENGFVRLKDRLDSISLWSKFAGSSKFVFQLTDSDGYPKQDSPSIDDKIKIQLPGPKDTEGEGYDWVKIIRKEDGQEGEIQFHLLELSPCECPISSGKATAHFYDSASTNTFVASLHERTVQVSVHGRNEEPNKSEQNIFDKIRNFIMANSGILGASRLQWEIFTDNIMKYDNE